MYEEITRVTEDFDSIYCMGSGGQGSVYKAKLSSTITVAMKKLHHLWDGEKNLEEGFLNEIRALTEIRHRNIVKLYGFCLHHQHSFLVCEFLERGSLAKILSKAEEAKEVGWRKRVNIVNGVAHALAYMHHDIVPPIVHRDISSKNILLDFEYETFVSDFGIANFGVVAFDIIMGRHPKDFFSSFSTMPYVLVIIIYITSPSNANCGCSGPTHFASNASRIKGSSLSCEDCVFMLASSPQSRPTMKQVSQLLSTQKLHLSKPLCMITCGELLTLDPLTV
ncbi:hypothetical protein ACFX15_011905 [Malus domestica]